MGSRKCRCGCNKYFTDTIVFPSGRKLSRPVKCGYCGNEVNQNTARHETGKWFHTECVSDYANFTKFVTKLEPSTKTHQFLKDYVLTQMIMRKDLRQLHREWRKLSKLKSIPIILRPKLNPEIIVFE